MHKMQVKCGIKTGMSPLRRPSTRRSAVVVKASKDVVLRSLSANAQVAVLVCDGKELVQEAADRHSTVPTATAALGRALVGAVLLGVYRRDDEQIQINWMGDGPLGGIMVMANHKGQARGKVGTPGCNMPLRPNGKFDIGGAVGRGVLSVIRSHPLEPNPYTGTVAIYNGEIAQDLATYMLESEQMNCAMALGVQINTADGRVRTAGGYFVQVLPFADDETLAQLEENLRSMTSMSDLLAAGSSASDITAMILAGIGAREETITITPSYGPCEQDLMRERMMNALAAIGREEVEDILKTDGQIEVRCDLCNESVVFTSEHADKIYQLSDALPQVKHIYDAKNVQQE